MSKLLIFLKIIVTAKRSRKFYSVQQSTLCDICEGAECDKTCTATAVEEKLSEISSKSVSNSTLTN